MTQFDSRNRADPPRLPDGFDVPFADAIAWARERKSVLPAEFCGVRLQAVRARAFTVSGLAALDQVQQVADSMAEATAQGRRCASGSARWRPRRSAWPVRGAS